MTSAVVIIMLCMFLPALTYVITVEYRKSNYLNLLAQISDELIKFDLEPDEYKFIMSLFTLYRSKLRLDTDQTLQLINILIKYNKTTEDNTLRELLDDLIEKHLM